MKDCENISSLFAKTLLLKNGKGKKLRNECVIIIIIIEYDFNRSPTTRWLRDSRVIYCI